MRHYDASNLVVHPCASADPSVVVACNDDAVLIPEGYHPFASPPGYTTYYLNVLAGSAQSLANKEDPQHAWVRDTYQGQDPRVPIYDISRQ